MASASDEAAKAIASLLGGRTASCAESCTAGRIAQAFATVPGSADWFRGGLVAYQLEIKRRYLGVQASSMFSTQCAAEMARGAAKFFDSDIAVSTTGVVGDAPEEGVASGTVFIATFVSGDVAANTYRFEVSGDLASQQAAERALDDLLAHLRKAPRPAASLRLAT